MKNLILALAVTAICSPALAQETTVTTTTTQQVITTPVPPDDTLVLKLIDGKVVIKLMPDKAPKTVEQIKALTRDGFYNNLAWFRVIPNFIAQTGYPKGSNGKSELPDLPDEFNDYPFVRGTVGMGHSQQPNSANSQFFICLSDEKCRGLTGQYTAFGKVVQGMELLDKLPTGEPPKKPGKLSQAYILGDRKKKEQLAPVTIH